MDTGFFGDSPSDGRIKDFDLITQPDLTRSRLPFLWKISKFDFRGDLVV